MKNSRVLLADICNKYGTEFAGIAPPGPYTDLGISLEKINKDGNITGFEEKDIRKRTDPRETMKDARSVIVCLFPYYSEAAACAGGNISIHARVADYHKVILEKLNKIGEELQKQIPGFEFVSFTDTGPLVDRYLAYIAGLGYRGLSSNFINDKYGSYIFIGYMINNHPFAPDKPQNAVCLKCKACIRSCPGGAIKENYGMDPKSCLSYITQKKGELSAWETKLLENHPMIYGCDICQEVCPLNSGLPETPIAEFKENLICNIDADEINEMSEKEFRQKFGDRTFAWRGASLLKRNLKIVNNK